MRGGGRGGGGGDGMPPAQQNRVTAAAGDRAEILPASRKRVQGLKRILSDHSEA